MCQKCFNASTSTSNSSSSSTATSMTFAATATSVSNNEILKFTGEKSARSSISRSLVKDPQKSPETASDKERSCAYHVAKKEVNRCSGCRRRVGLTGFRCRCGELFCWEHRYSDRHDCSYDYKTAGREAIARENPVVKAAKIVRVWIKKEDVHFRVIDSLDTNRIDLDRVRSTKRYRWIIMGFKIIKKFKHRDQDQILRVVGSIYRFSFTFFFLLFFRN